MSHPETSTPQEESPLPKSMRVAQEAINTPEVQAIMKRLADFNLGICMPHMHIREGEFTELPIGMLTIEQKSEFVSVNEADPVETLPVAWRWSNGSAIVARSCHIVRKKCG